MNPYVDGLPDEVRGAFDRRYAELFAFFVKHRERFSRITLWGVGDGQSWRNHWPVPRRTDYPLLFDRRYQPKSVVAAVIDVAPEESGKETH